MSNDIILAGDMRKLALHPEILEARRVPITVQLSPTGRCNLRCRFCTRGDSPSRSELDWSTLERIVRMLSDMGTKGVEITGGGEPTMHSHLGSLIAEVVEEGMDCALVTNGTRLTRIPAGVLGAMDWIRVSLNAGPKTYKRVHGKDRYRSALDGVYHMAECARVHKGVSIIVDEKTDWKDIGRLFLDLDGANLDYIRIARDGRKLDIPYPMDVIEELPWPKEAKRLLEEKRDVTVPPDCVIGYYKPTISHTGQIHRCCAEFNAEANAQGHWYDMPSLWRDEMLSRNTEVCHAYPCIYARYNAFILDCWARKVKNPNFI